MMSSAAKTHNPLMQKAGKHTMIARRGKTIEPEAPENILRFPSTGKTYHRFQATIG